MFDQGFLARGSHFLEKTGKKSGWVDRGHLTTCGREENCRVHIPKYLLAPILIVYLTLCAHKTRD